MSLLMTSAAIKNLALFFMVYSCVVTVFLVAHWGRLSGFFKKVFSDFSGKQRFLLLFSVANVLLVWVVFFFFYLLDFNIETNIGQIGDFVGGLLNPILSFMALIAILISIGVQERELSSSVSALRSQEAVFKIQSFESSFFNVLALNRQRRAEHTFLSEGGKTVKHSEDIAKKMKKYRASLEARSDLTPLGRHRLGRRYVIKHSNRIWSGEIFRQFLMIQKMIANAGLDHDQRAYYFSIAFNDFDSYEKCIYCNLLTVRRVARKLFKKYGLTCVKDDWLVSPLLHVYLRDH